MAAPAEQNSRGFLRFAGPVGMALFVLAMLATWRITQPQAFDFQANPYAIPWLIGTLSNLSLIGLLLKFRVKTLSTQWFLLFLAGLTTWASCELLQELSRTAEAAFFWSTLSSFGFVTVAPTFYVFALAFLRRDVIKRPLTIGFLVVSTAFFLHLALDTNLVIAGHAYEMEPKYWGLHTPLGKLFPFFFVWFEALFITPLLMLIRHYRHATRAQVKRQTRLIIIAIFIPFTVGTFTDGLLPSAGIVVFPTAMLLTSVMAAIITYAILESDLLIVSPAAIATNILEAMQEAVLVVGPGQLVEYANRQAAELFGSPDDQMEGTPVKALFGPGTAALLKRLKPSSSREFSEAINVKVGTDRQVPVNVTAAPIRDEGGHDVGTILILTDVTQLERSNADLHQKVRQIREQNSELAELGDQLTHEKSSIERKVRERTRELEENRARLLASINGLELGYVLCTQDERIVLHNAAATRILDLSGREFAGEPLERLLTDGGTVLARIRKGMKERRVLQLAETPYGDRFLRVYLSPVTLDQRSIGTVILIQDITEQKILDRSRDEFFSIASHELRTPLTAIRGYSDLLQQQYVPKLKKDELFKRSVDNIFISSTNLIKIVNEFLDLSRLEQGRIPFTPSFFAIEELVDEVIQSFETMLSERDLHAVFRPPKRPLPIVWADRDKTQQILVNLVGNAIKYTESGGVGIQLRAEEDYLEIKVRDSGFGIPPENQGFLFRKFQQAESDILTRDASKGTGLGLYISKLMVEGMGGRIFLEHSHPGHGSTFTFTLPTKKRSATRP